MNEFENIDEYIDSLENLQQNVSDIEEQLVDIDIFLRDLEESKGDDKGGELEEARMLFDEISDLVKSLREIIEKTKFLISDIEAGEPTQESLEDKILSAAETLDEGYNLLEIIEKKKRELDDLISSLE